MPLQTLLCEMIFHLYPALLIFALEILIEFFSCTLQTYLYVTISDFVLSLTFATDACLFFRHYKQAYGHLLDLRMHDTNLLEIKTIAGFISYKVGRTPPPWKPPDSLSSKQQKCLVLLLKLCNVTPL